MSIASWLIDFTVLSNSMASPKGSSTSQGTNKTVLLLHIPGPLKCPTSFHSDKRTILRPFSDREDSSSRELDNGSLEEEKGDDKFAKEDDVTQFAESYPLTSANRRMSQDDDISDDDLFSTDTQERTGGRADVNKCPPGSSTPEIVPVLKRTNCARDKARDARRTVSLSDPPQTADVPTLFSSRAAASGFQVSDGLDSVYSASPSSSNNEVPVLSKRRISFPADSVLTAVIQDADTPELVRILSGRHGPGVVQSVGEGGVARGVDVCQTNHVGLTALHHAVLANNLDAAKLLLCYGADVNAQDVHGFSPLHAAAACGFLPLTSLLLLFGADVFALTREKELPVDLAKELEVVRLLTAEMTRLIHKELWVTSVVRARAEDAWLFARKVLAWVLVLMLQLLLFIRTKWKKQGKSD